MSKTNIVTAYAGAILGTVFGMALSVVSLGLYFINSTSSWATFCLNFTALGCYILFWALIGFLGLALMEIHPVIGSLILIISAIGGSLMSYSLILWGIPAFLEITAVILTFKDISRQKNLAKQYYSYSPIQNQQF